MLGHALRQQAEVSRAVGRVFGRQYVVDQSLGAGATFTRAGTATTIFPPSWGVTSVDATASNNVARFVAGGVLLEPTSKNYADTSDSLSSPATRTLDVTGAFTLWVSGTASVTIAAGTATGTGWGTATANRPVALNITGAGTVTLTKNSGAFNQTGAGAYIYQLESLAVPSSFIPNTGASATRAADSSISYPLTTPQTEGMAVIEFEFPSGAAGAGGFITNRSASVWGWLYSSATTLLNSYTGNTTVAELWNSNFSRAKKRRVGFCRWGGGFFGIGSNYEGSFVWADYTSTYSSWSSGSNVVNVAYENASPIIVRSVSVYSVNKGQAWLQERFK